MAFTRIKAKGRREAGPFVALPCSVLSHPNRKALSFKGSKLLFDLLDQLRFGSDGPTNNGDLTIAWAIMKEHGWSSKETLHNAVKELEYYGFIKLTRQGGRHKCSLYAVTWWAINECGGKLDIKETSVPSNEWKMAKENFKAMNHSRSEKKSCPDYLKN